MTDESSTPAPQPTPPPAPEVTPGPTAAKQVEAPALDGAPLAPPSDVSVDLVKLALRKVKDPELNLNIVDLGLVYDVRVEGNDVQVDMSLTSPGCPSGPEIMAEAEKQVRAMDGVGDVVINLVWSPYWTPERIEPRMRAYLGF